MPEFLNVVRFDGATMEERSPKSVDELRQMPVEEIAEYVRQWQSSGRIPGSYPRRASLCPVETGRRGAATLRLGAADPRSITIAALLLIAFDGTAARRSKPGGHFRGLGCSIFAIVS